MAKISVLLPSQLKKPFKDRYCVLDALASIRQQSGGHDIETIIALDPGVSPPPEIASLATKVVNGPRKRMEACLDAAFKASTGEYVAILQDDDEEWHLDFLDLALQALQSFDFVSSTATEIGPDGSVTGIDDFSTPSSWVFRREVMERVGPLPEHIRYLTDRYWLGLLGEYLANQSRLDLLGKYRGPGSRVHFIESTAPINPARIEARRPFLWAMIQNSRPQVTLYRHNCPYPLVGIRMYEGSLSMSIAHDVEKFNADKADVVKRFGRLPS